MRGRRAGRQRQGDGSQEDGERGGTPVHNPLYDFNDDLLPFGAGYLATLVEQELG